jgi:hypothetical protein
LSGVAFASWLLADPARLLGVEKNFTVPAFAVPPKNLTEDLSRKQFEKEYGSTSDARFLKEMQALRKKVKELAGYRRIGPM